MVQVVIDDCYMCEGTGYVNDYTKYEDKINKFFEAFPQMVKKTQDLIDKNICVQCMGKGSYGWIK